MAPCEDRVEPFEVDLPRSWEEGYAETVFGGAKELEGGDTDRMELGDIVLGGPGIGLGSYELVGGVYET